MLQPDHPQPYTMTVKAAGSGKWLTRLAFLAAHGNPNCAQMQRVQQDHCTAAAHSDAQPQSTKKQPCRQGQQYTCSSSTNNVVSHLTAGSCIPSMSWSCTAVSNSYSSSLMQFVLSFVMLKVGCYCCVYWSYFSCCIPLTSGALCCPQCPRR